MSRSSGWRQQSQEKAGQTADGVALLESAFFSDCSPSTGVTPSSSVKRDSQHVGLVMNFTCSPSVTVTGQGAEIEIVTVSDPSVLVPSDVLAIALDFKVLHPVVITRLGVFPSGTQPDLQSNVTVKLLQLDQEVTEPQPVNII